MATPTQRRTNSSKRRRASHFALTAKNVTKTSSGALHLSHRAAPGATEYNGKPIHVKGGDRILKKLTKKPAHDSHEGHTHA